MTKRFILLLILCTTATFSIEINWQQSTSSNMTHNIYDICWSGTNFITVGDSGTIHRSPDGVAWEKATTNSRQKLYAVCASQTTIVAVGGTSKLNQSNGQSDKDVFCSLVLRSADNGVTWDSIPVPTDARLRDVCWNGSSFVATGFSVIGPYTYVNGTVLHSQDGTRWEKIEVPGIGNGPHTIRYLNNTCFLGTYSTIFSSPDGKDWNKLYDASIYQADYSKLFSIGEELYFDTEKPLVSSSDGINWNETMSEETIIICYRTSTQTEDLEIIATDSGNYIIHESVVTKVDSDTSRIKLLISSDNTLISITNENSIQYAEIPSVSSVLSQSNMEKAIPFLLKENRIILPQRMNYSFKLYSTRGQELRSLSGNSNIIRLNTRDFSHGVYLFQLTTGDFRSNGRLTIKW